MWSVPEVTGGRRERKKHQTSVALAEAALRLFAENGFAETTVDEIAEAADMSSRTFFRHFSSKEAVVFADDDQRRDAWIKALRDRPRHEPILVTIREASLVLAEDYEPGKDFFRWELAMRHRSVGARWLQIGNKWELVLAEEIALRLGLPSKYDVTARTLAAAAMGAWRVAQANWVYERGQRPLGHHLLRTYSVLATLGTLTPPKVVIRQFVDVREPDTDPVET